MYDKRLRLKIDLKLRLFQINNFSEKNLTAFQPDKCLCPTKIYLFKIPETNPVLFFCD